MRKLLVFAAALTAAAFWAVPALAQGSGTGYVEICKNSAAAPGAVGGSFAFTVNDTISVSVPVGACSQPIEVPAGTATIDEATGSWWSVASITVRDSSGSTTNATPGPSVTVPVTAGDMSMETLVTYTNQLVTGTLEVCKSAQAGSGVTGSFQFTVTGGNAFSQTLSVAVGTCSQPITVPAGQLKVAETGDASTYVTAIATQPAGALTWSDLGTATATVAVAPGGVDNETAVTFTNSMSLLKICKVAGTGYTTTTPSTFTVGGTSVSVAPGNCALVPGGSYRAGTLLTVAETPMVGAAVDLIQLNGTDQPDISAMSPLPALGANYALGTFAFNIGPGVNEVSFENVPAVPVPLKVCKAGAGSGTFTVDGTSIGSLSAGQCTQFASYPYGSSVSIAEMPAAGYVLSSVAADGNGVLTASDTTAGTASVTVRTYPYYNDAAGFHPVVVTFTDAAAPPPAPAPVPPPATSGGGGSAPAPPPPPPAAPTTSGSTGGTAGTSTGSTGSTSALHGSTTPKAIHAKTSLVKILAARIVNIRNGVLAGRWFAIRVHGFTLTRHVRIALRSHDRIVGHRIVIRHFAKVRITLVNSHGKVIGHRIRLVRTGQLVRVMRIGKQVRTVRVSPFSV